MPRVLIQIFTVTDLYMQAKPSRQAPFLLFHVLADLHIYKLHLTAKPPFLFDLQDDPSTLYVYVFAQPI